MLVGTAPRLACVFALLGLMLAMAAPCQASGVAVHGTFAGNPPFSRLNEQGRPEGLCPDLAASLAGAVGWRVHHAPVRRQAARTLLKSGAIDFYFTFVAQNEASPTGLAFGPAVLSSGLVLATREEDNEAGIGCIKSFKPVGVVRGGWEERALVELRGRHHGRCLVSLFPSRVALALALARGDVASALVPACTVGALQGFCKGIDLYVSAPLAECGSGKLVPVFREKDSEGRRRFAQALERFRQSGGLGKVLQIWAPGAFSPTAD